jgi:hypothetical protein
MSKDLYCALAANSISFGQSGGSRPCCAVQVPNWLTGKHELSYYNNELLPWFNNEDIVKLRGQLLQNEWPDVCSLCRDREEVGQPSTRQIWNDSLYSDSLRIDNPVVTDLSKIVMLEVTVGNKCNSACLMCNASASSLWQIEQEKISGKKLNWVKPDWFVEQHVPHLIDSLPNLKKINFLGGEPTISEPHLLMLRRLIEQGRSKDISLYYVTNLSGVSKELLDLWDNFDKLHVTISVDGVGMVNEYIRYPFTWKKVTDHIQALKDISSKNPGKYFLSLSHTISIFNLLTIDTFLEWWEDQVGPGGFADTLPHLQCVNQPVYMDPIYASKEMKDAARASLERVRKMSIRRNLGDKYTAFIENITENVLNKEVEEELRTFQWIKLQDYVVPLDKLRNRNILAYLPHMRDYWAYDPMRIVDKQHVIFRADELRIK